MSKSGRWLTAGATDPVLAKGRCPSHQLASAPGWNASDGMLRQVDASEPASAYHRKLVRLAFLAPDLQRATLKGRQTPDLTFSGLLDEPISARLGSSAADVRGSCLAAPINHRLRENYYPLL